MTGEGVVEARIVSIQHVVVETWEFGTGKSMIEGAATVLPNIRDADGSAGCSGLPSVNPSEDDNGPDVQRS